MGKKNLGNLSLYMALHPIPSPHGGKIFPTFFYQCTHGSQGVTIWAVGGHDVGLVADQAQHHHSGVELGHYYDGDLDVALPIHFFDLRQVFLN